MQIRKFLQENFKFPFWFSLGLAAIILYSIWVRIQGLGYSNFQGDEVNTVDFIYEMKSGVLNYLLSQKRGPVQYIINILNVSLFGYYDELWIRVPYLITGILALYTVYRLSRKIFGPTVAYVAASLMAVNGLFIAFARITQYQSLMYFVIPIAVLLFINSLENFRTDRKKLFFAAILTALSLLIHYDTMSVMPFFIMGTLTLWYREASEQKEFKKNFTRFLSRSLIFFVPALGLALAYYVPFYMNQAFNDTTSGYLQGRLFGGEFKGDFNSILNLFMPETALSMKLLTMYIPKFFIYTFLIMGLAGVFAFYRRISGWWKFSEKLMKYFYIFAVAMILFGSWFSLYPVKPRASSLIVFIFSLVVIGILAISKKVEWYKVGLVAWFLGAYSFYFYMMRDPRTHVYVSMIPLFILSAYGFNYLLNRFSSKIYKFGLMAALLLVYLYVSGINYVVFVDKAPEYPWWDKDFLGQPVYRIKRVRHEKIEGVFGFNNYRGWEQVAVLYKRGCLTGTFNSNEKNSITYFYMQQDQKKLDEWDVKTDADTMIIVEGPHSWQYYETKYLPERFKLLKTIESNGVPVSFIYGDERVYPQNKLLCE